MFGYGIELSLEDYIQRSVYLGTYERRESSLIKRHLTSGMTFLDVGANIGYYSLMAAAVAGPSGRIVAFEPNPHIFNHFKRTIEKNRISHITLEQYALADAAGTCELFVPIEAGNNTATMIANEGGSPVSVPVITLDDYLDRNDIEHVDFMKIDVEGYEPRIIAGAQATIKAKKIDAILCEFSGHWLRQDGTTPQDFYEFMRSLGLRASEQRTPNTEFENILFTPH